MSYRKILEELMAGGHSSVKFGIVDVDGVLRAKMISMAKLKEVIADGVGFCDVIFGWDSQDKCYSGVKITGLHTGYPDGHCTLDLNSMRFLPTDNNIAFFLGDMHQDEIRSACCPRSLLRRIIAQGEEQGFKAMFSQEFEWFNFQRLEAGVSEISKRDLKPLSSGMFGYSQLRPAQNKDYFHGIFSAMEAMDIPLDALHTETGPGVYEAAIGYDETLVAADKAVLFKNTVKELASEHGITASFMAKHDAKLPGCSGHLHQSLWDLNLQQNLFISEPDGKLNELMESYMAGVLIALPDLLPMYAPTINSYKRLNGGDWAPNSVSWGFDNRTSSLRVLPSLKKSARLELRVPGSDSNPYLAMAASLASGLYGIRHQLKLSIPPTQGNAYDSESERLSSNLLDATRRMQQSDLAKELLGADFVEHFTETRRWECQQHEQMVSDWELNRYFEII